MPRAASPRRSARARPTLPPTTSKPTTSSHSSSISSSRAERATRANHKSASSQKSSTPRSLSSGEAEDASEPRQPPTRRRTRESDLGDVDDNAEINEAAAENQIGDVDEDGEDQEEEEEITRCICGRQEYPGPPEDTNSSRHQRANSSAGDTQEEAGGLFIQCDSCKVWQHGGCVGIMDEASTPDEYYCEQCRKDLHRVMTSNKGLKYSHYLPVLEPNKTPRRRKSMSRDVDAKSPKSREQLIPSTIDSLTKRRSTMNSRAAYDEDEALRKALEESRDDGRDEAQSSTRNGKRSRADDSEDMRLDLKRQRTTSRSISSPTSERSGPILSDDDDIQKTQDGAKKMRGATAKSQRDRETRDRAKVRAEAASRRNGRAERRRADDESEPPEETPGEGQITPVKQDAEGLKASSGSPAPASGAAGSGNKKSGRPPAKRGRLGRNQSTRDRDLQISEGGHSASRSPHRASSRARANQNGISPDKGSKVNGARDSGDGVGADYPSSNTKNGKNKHARQEKNTMNDLRRRAALYLEYISMVQAGVGSGKDLASDSKANVPGGVVNGVDAPDSAPGTELTTADMMAKLSSDLLKFQEQYGKVAEKE